ncbi:MAG: DUF3455 domain-containing protein [Xenococcaceae cyanobacterium]
MIKSVKISAFLLIASLLNWSPLPVRAESTNFCKIPQSDRSLVSQPVVNLESEISKAMRSLDLEGEIEKIIWAKGTQSYEMKPDGSMVSFGPSADLLSVESKDNKIVPVAEKVGSHYKVGNLPAWEFPSLRLIAQEVAKLEGAGNNDVPWLAIKTDREGYYVLRLETRGGLPPEEECQFSGIVGIPYETIYVVIKDNSSAKKSNFFNK